MDTVYIETSIVSHATAWPSKDPVTAVLQQQAQQWWDEEREHYRLVTSQFVIDEAADGDAEAARLRLEMLDGIPLLLHSERVEEVTEEQWKLLIQFLVPLTSDPEGRIERIESPVVTYGQLNVVSRRALDQHLGIVCGVAGDLLWVRGSPEAVRR